MSSNPRLLPSPSGIESLVAMLAHDVRGPLNTINISAEVLDSAILSGAEVERLTRHCRVISTQAKRLARRLENVLMVLSGMKGEPVTFDLRQTIREASSAVAATASAREVTMDLKLPVEPVQVFGHASILGQALREIAVNSIESAPRQGHVHVVLDSEDDCALLDVDDSGPGIDLDDPRRIFAADYSTKDPGRGFGLRFASGIVNAHGGTLEVLQSPLGGARMRLALRRHTPPEI